MPRMIFLLLVVLGLGAPNCDAKKTINPLSLKRVMVCAPHPDDDILGCGGAIAQHRRNGAHVTIVYMTSGDAEKLSGITGPELAAIREAEAKKGAAKVGVTDLVFLRNPDGKLARSAENVAQLRTLIFHQKPDLVYTPHKSDAHEDHKTTFWLVEQAVKEAIKADAEFSIPLVLCYEVWTPLQKLTHKIDISSVIDIKLDALSEHKSQLIGVSNTNYIDAVKGLNRYRGIMNWVGAYAECFQQLVCER